MLQAQIAGMNILSVAVGLLVGGFASTIIILINGYLTEKKERKIRFLEKQLRKLYGPVFYFTSQSEKLFELNNRFQSAYTKEYVEQTWSQNPETQKYLKQEALDVLDIANKYITQVEEKNKQIEKALNENYSFIDPDDIETMLLFYEHHVRLTTERSESGRLKTPIRIQQQVGTISFLKPEVIDRIKMKSLSKKKELEKLVKR
jgi:hypothetical protein